MITPRVHMKLRGAEKPGGGRRQIVPQSAGRARLRREDLQVLPCAPPGAHPAGYSLLPGAVAPLPAPPAGSPLPQAAPWGPDASSSGTSSVQVRAVWGDTVTVPPRLAGAAGLWDLSHHWG